MKWLAGVVVALALLAPAAEAKTVRVFSVGLRFDPSWVVSRDAFHRKLDTMLAPLARLGRDRDLAVLPEDVGLLAAFSGSRGEGARAAEDLTSAIAALTAAYATPIAVYATQYPGLGRREVPTRLLALALTDTFGRVAVESFAELADRYDLWLEAGIDMARDFKIVCVSKATYVPPPGGEPCAGESPQLVAALGDPQEPTRQYAYVAVGPDPVNMALLFNPDGKLVSKQVKSYLTPVELPGQLDLVPGDPHALTAVDTPVGKLGFVTSKDAWMPDVTGRLDDAGTQILVQPEFFVGDTVKTTGMWAPDNLKAAGYSDLLRHPSLQAMALPELTGDVKEFSADAQSHIAVRPSPGGPAGALVGQAIAPGFAQVQGWLATDPLTAPIAQRRATLGAAGEAAVGTGTQQEGVLTQDVQLDTPRYRPVRRRRDQPLSPSRTQQRHVSLASRGKRAWAAWDEGGDIRMAVSVDHGRTFKPARTRGQGSHPALSIAGHGPVWLTFQRADGKAVAAAGRDRPRALAPRGGRQERPRIAAFPGGNAYAVWLDDRSGEVGVYGAQVGDPPVRLDQGDGVPLAAQLDNSWAPDVVQQDKKVVVTWADFRAYKWDIYARVSSDRGVTFAPQLRINDTPDNLESLDDTPRAGFLKGDPYIAWTDFRHRDDPAPHPLYDVRGAFLGGANRQLDTDGKRQLDAFAPSLGRLRHGRLAVAWQSHKRATADVMVREIGSAARRADDARRRDVNSWRPAVTGVGTDRVLVAWEDDRDGVANVFKRVLVLPSAPSP